MYYENFEKLCNLNGVRPGTVSKATGISTATLTSWKQGKYTPKMDKLQIIADYFHVSVEYLTSGEDKSEQSDNRYYINEETSKMAQSIFENKELRMLFDAACDATPEDLETVHSMLIALKRKERGNIVD